MTPPPANPPATHPLALPASFSPDAIDALTELSLILSELKPTVTSGSPQTQTQAQSQSQSQSQTLVGSSAHTQPSDPTSSDPSHTQPSHPSSHQTGIPSSQSQTQVQAPNHPSGGDQTTTLDNTTQLLGVSNIGDLPLRDIAAAADEIKHKLQRARMQMRALPDMDRSIAEQEEEMAYLEERMREQRQVLEMLKGVWGGNGDTGGGPETVEYPVKMEIS